MAKENTDQSTSVNISSNTLFHFTNSMDNLLNILTNDFSPHFCPEYKFLEPTHEGGNIISPKNAFPMVSFCDLPLFLIKKHVQRYGPYGIGLKKTWGLNNRLTPIYYCHSKSMILDSLKYFFNYFDNEIKNTKDSQKHKFLQSLAIVEFHLKLYEGPAWRNGKLEENIKFYDEREWRFVPDYFNIRGMEYVLDRAEYMDNDSRRIANDTVAEKSKLPFTPNDIQYLIMQEESEILQMIRDIERIKGNRYTTDDVKILTTKIISSERISEDS
ncbi:MAG: hypothetical protein C0412_19690 [Flavobacterium sp.]|nr:hypothetical protein [Flavobacterium sp.]